MDLIEAAKNGDRAKLEELLEGGADASLRNERGETALMWAALRGDRDMVRKLLKAGAQLDARTRSRWANALMSLP